MPSARFSGAAAYQPLRAPRHEIHRVRGLDIHLTRWGPDPSRSREPIFLLHGWQDTGDTFQFMVDALRQDWPLVAHDWRGFGRSEWPQEGYWFPDYIADLDELLRKLSPDAPARLVGHSMGGNVASLYAGARPDRVRCVVNLEGFGLPPTSPAGAAALLRKWLTQLTTPLVSKDYESFEQLAFIIGARYPRFSAAQADFVARAWSKVGDDGRVHLLGDPRHHWVTPTQYQREEAKAIWREATAPTLLVLGSESEYLPKLKDAGSDEVLRGSFTRIARIEDAGHMLHIEKPNEVAALVEEFMSAH